MSGKELNTSAASTSLLKQAVRVAPGETVDANGNPVTVDARDVFAEPPVEDSNWMSKAITQQREQRLVTEVEEFMRNWTLSGFTPAELVEHVTRMYLNDEAKVR